MALDAAAMIEFDGITKSFPGVRALKSVSFSIREGEIHALMGENGAGKSTLLNILHGVYIADLGQVSIGGKKVRFRNPTEALTFGISKVHQEVNLVGPLSVAQNIALGFEPRNRGFLDFKTMNARADEILADLGCRFKGADSIDGLSVGEMQMITVAKALYHKARVISFDEPTASLSNWETEKLFEIIASLKARGITILYVSHKLDEVYRLSDRVSILRDGHYISTSETAELDRRELIRNMVGRDVASFAVRQHPSRVQEEKVLEVDRLCGAQFSDVSFYLRKGEILSFAGLVGAKRTEIVRALYGADRVDSGTVVLKGKQVAIKRPEHALRLGIGLLPENRKTQGFIKYFTNAGNVSFAALPRLSRGPFLDQKAMLKNFAAYADLINMNPRHPDILTENLSGGNQQKAVLAKILSTGVDILIFDEPTKGIDVGAKAEIYALMEKLAGEGKSIIMVSSELPEVIGMSDRVLVVREGRIAACLERGEATEEKIIQYAMGV